MSRNAKYDAYFDQLKKVGDFIEVPANSSFSLSSAIHNYQKTKSRNKKNLRFSCKTTKDKINQTTIFRVFAVGKLEQEKGA